jgi:hypothetical protein
VCGSWSGKHRVEILCLYTITVSVFGKFPKGWRPSEPKRGLKHGHSKPGPWKIHIHGGNMD